MKQVENYQSELLWIESLKDGLEETLRVYDRYKYPHILETANSLKYLIAQEEASLKAIRDGIKKLDDPLLIDVLTMRYIDGQTLDKTADALFFSYTHTSRLVRKAKRQLTEITNN